jgi:SAM-dependent methyltransferase
MRTYSILRTCEDEAVSTLSLTGRVLDLGGHKGSSYFSRLKSEMPVEVANFDSMQEGTHKTSSCADHVFDFEYPFPLEGESFNAVLSINVLEHIYNYTNVLTETYRILQKGGSFYIAVPFFFNIHGSPNDYFRYTESALERMLRDAGFTDVRITVLGGGPCSALFQTFGGSLPTLPLKMLVKTLAIQTDALFSRLSSRYASIKRRVPLGYFVEAHKA